MARSTVARSGGRDSCIGSPVRSSVVVRMPKRIVARYTLGSASRNGSSRVARPTSRIRRPVANGSRVPACPMRRVPSTCRTRSTAVCEVMPAGLSTRSNPSVAPSLIIRLFVAHLGEELLDARRTRDALVDLEAEAGRDAETEHARQPRAEVAAHALEGLQRRRALDVGAHHAHEDLRVTQVLR